MQFPANFMHSFDDAVVLFFNKGVRKSWMFDQIIAFLSVSHLLKGGIFMAIAWWAWFRNDHRNSQDREHIISTILSCAVAMAVGRILVLALPFRARPLHEAGLNLVLPYGVASTALGEFSTFPSDHAVLFFALATGLSFVSMRAGVFAFAYATLCIALPRIYLGLHYPTDILAGAMIGMTISLLGNLYLPNRRGIQSVANFADSTPRYFYPLFFLLTFQMAELFESSRMMLGGLFKFLRQVVA